MGIHPVDSTTQTEERGMRRKGAARAVVVLVAALGLLSSVAWTPARSRSADDALALLTALRSDLGGILRSATASWRNSRWSVLAVSLDRGDTLFAIGSSDALAPASNLKLLTTATATHLLGTDFRFQTFLLASGSIEGGRLQGDLVLYGTGDPGLSDRFQPSGMSVLESFADSLTALGVRTVEGDLVGDGSYFSGPLLGDGWNPNDLNDSFAAPSTALSFNENVFTLRLRGAGVGSKLEVLTLPDAAGVPIDNRSTFGGGAGLRVRREHPLEPVLIEGQVPAGAREIWRQLTVPDPAHFAASVFRHVLEQRGIHVLGSTRSTLDTQGSHLTRRRVFAPAVEREPAPRILARHVSPPLLEYLVVVNKRSHNLLADHVLKTVGRVVEGDGSFPGGARAVAGFLARDVGVDTSHVALYDGSGLSPMNRVSAADFVALMSFMSKQGTFEAFLGTLPEAGSRDLRRMSRTAAAGNLRAKTGTIRSVSALSGIVHTSSGERIAFSIISNAVPSTGGVKGVEDRIGSRLASFDRPAPTDEMAGAVLAQSSAPTAAEGQGLSAPASPAMSTTAAEVPVESSDGSGLGDGATDPAAPVAQTHRVSVGDNFTVIARRYGIPVNSLIEANPELSPRRLKVGTLVSIPVRTARPQ
jgi:D-alanyl-D-alanine carboxypeptidase/D-alanyl-D-alanine-endopeptidase (penicillin-binding protein 4)